ncbi:MAG: hypothetical protein BSOLF_1908 [Candidatus Carbobacillus altaicus]|uniref:Uncharacterized protein n=1 Tax=Candidatus Carbonibacillus altaicus TaxID=2163959 RepID=A0A2R6XYP8_9BACL|nr:MAG: hypothetical protein BSOLF_1908 [Candidatus Carbobacillus altaicus]
MGEPEGYQPDVPAVRALRKREPKRHPVPVRKCGYRGHADAVGAWNVSLAISGLAEAA